MQLNKSNKPQVVGIVVLFVGVALLGFTFVNAFLFLQEPLGAIAAADLTAVFGEALPPLVQSCVRLVYLGVMGWIGSLLTLRGIPLITYRNVSAAAEATTPQMQGQTRKEAKAANESTPASTLQPQQNVTRQQPLPPNTKASPGQEVQPAPEIQAEPRAILIPPENQREE